MNLHLSTQLASLFQLSFRGKVFAPFLTAKHQLNLKLQVVCLLAKPLCSLSYGNITLLESDHDIKGYQVSDLISWDIRTVELASDWLIVNLGTVTYCYYLVHYYHY